MLQGTWVALKEMFSFSQAKLREGHCYLYLLKLSCSLKLLNAMKSKIYTRCIAIICITSTNACNNHSAKNYNFVIFPVAVHTTSH